MGVCKPITLLILCYISSRLATLLLKSLMTIYKSLIFLILLPVSSSSILAFRYFFFLFLKYLLASRLTLFRSPTLLWFGSYNQCILAWLLRSKNREHASSNHGLCCFSSYRPRLSLAEGFGALCNVFYVLAIIEVLQGCKPVSHLNLIFCPKLKLTKLAEFKFTSHFSAACLLRFNFSLTNATTTWWPVSVSSREKLYIQYTRMSSHIY